MSDKPSDQPVKVTAERRAHPALRTLARACIALARWQRDNDNTAATSSSTPTTKPPAPSVEQPKEEAGDV